MKNIYLFEPSIASNNTGDEIIVQGVKKALERLIKENYIIEMPTHMPLSNRYALFLGSPDLKIVCGSNIITGQLNQIRHVKQWALGYLTTWQLNNSVFIGVGAQRYQKCNAYTRLVYRKLFSKEYLHSARDAYTVRFLNQIGIKNVINTGCPTMWGLTPDHCKKIPTQKSNKVVLTLTDYSPDIKRDSFLISVLLKQYEKVYFWPQGNKDYKYFVNFKENNKIDVISPNLSLYDQFLESEDVDFVGTRLHGGMRALQKKRRTIIIGIDNRAIELHRDFNIPVINQEEISDLPMVINSSFKTEIKLKQSNISRFLNQFKKY